MDCDGLGCVTVKESRDGIIHSYKEYVNAKLEYFLRFSVRKRGYLNGDYDKGDDK